MVFEGILVDVLNRFLGPYVKNLDASQLKVGIWGGDVLLNTLELKENALDDFDVPIRIFGGYLYKLRLKIPWKNLYSAPVVAEVDGLYILAGPTAAAKYDADKEAKENREAKEKQLAKIEEARKKSKEDSAKEQTDPGFVEKLVTQIVKNVQITVKNIHICYEDAVTNPSNPVSFGVTLDSLFVQSTGSDYKIGGTSSSSSDPISALIYKVVQMNCLGVYWNSHVDLLGPSPPPDWTEVLKGRIARPGGELSPDVHYIVKPISAEVKLQLSLKAGRDPNIPQALIGVMLQEVAVTVEKQQFHGAMSLIESLDRMSINRKYRKYKPLVGLKQSPQAWWGYAIQAVLEEDVKRRTQMWSWDHIKEHRKRCREYTKLYTDKLLAGKSISTDLKSKLQTLEDQLDVLNITICRQRAEIEASRERERQEVARSEQSWWSWATGWATGGASDGKAAEFKPPTEEELAAERAKLYEAIGYSEGAKVTTYSAEYVAHRLNFDLKQVSLTLCNEEGRVACLSTHKLHVDLVHRPASNNIGVKASVDQLDMTGRSSAQEKGDAPVIISTEKEGATDHLLDAEFDLNPLKGKDEQQKVDQRIKLRLLPVEVVYDADTVDKIIDIFLLPKNVQLQKISAAAASTLEDLKTQTRAGLEHSISLRKLLDIDIVLRSPRVVIPENGRMTSSSSVLLADLGSLKVTSDMKFAIPDVSLRDASLDELKEAFYDHFNVSLTAVQVIVAGSGEDWKAARKMPASPYHILSPLGFEVQLKKSLLPNDTNLPSFIVNGKLPNICLDISDKKLKQVLKLVQSIPLPPPSLANREEAPSYSYEPEPLSLGAEGIIGSLSTSIFTSKEDSGDTSVDKDKTLEEEDEWYTADEGTFDEHGKLSWSPGYLEKIEEEEKMNKEKKRTDSDSTTEGDEVKSATKLQLQFEIEEIQVNFSEHDKVFDSDELGTPRLRLAVSSVTASVNQNTWNLVVSASMNSVVITDYFATGGAEPRLLLAAVADSEQDNEGKFLSVQYMKNDREAPHYQTTLECTQQGINVDLSLVSLNVQRESLANLLAVAKSIVSELKKKDDDSASKDEETPAVETSPLSSESLEKMGKKEVAKVVRFAGEKDLSVKAKLAGVELTLSDEHGEVLTADTKVLKANVEMLEDSINVKASIKHVGLVDKETGCLHPEVITEVEKEGDVIDTEVVVYQHPSSDLNSSELSVRAAVQRLRVTVLFRFLNRVKEFATELLTELQIDEETMESARKAAAETAAKTAEALKEQSSSRIRLDVIVHAPLVILPLSATSQSALIANLGSLTVKNTFLEASQVVAAMRGISPSDEGGFLSPTGERAIVDKMTISLTSIQFGRVENLAEEDIFAVEEDYMILKPLKFSGHVTRLLSGWCKEIPAIGVGVDLEQLEVLFRPRDFQALMTLLDSLNDGKTPSQPESPTEEEITTKPSPKADDEEKESDLKEPMEETTVSNIHVAANVGTIRLLLLTKDERLADIQVIGLSTDVDLKDDNKIIVKASIGDIGVTDLSDVTLYPKIVSVAEGTKALKAVVGVYPKATKSPEGLLDMTKHDLSVRAAVGQVKIVALFLFINRLLNYLKQFNVSEDAIESARKSAQEGASAAVTAVQETHASGQRLKLDISIQAPEITVPLKSDSKEVIVADLGSLSLSNTFHIAKRTDVMQQAAIYERHVIKLNNLKVFRSRYMDTSAPKQLIMEPFNFSTALERNLSASWFRDIPTITVNAKFENLSMVASGDDIESVCLILSGNLKEGVGTLTERESRPTESSSGGDDKVETRNSESQSHAEDEKDDATIAKQGEEKPFETLSVSAMLQSIEIKLYKASSDGSISDMRNPADSLANLILKTFKVGTKMISNGEMTVACSMEDCFLDDKRPKKKNGISRLIKRGIHDDADSSDSPEPLIKFEFTKSDDNDLSVATSVNNVEVLLDLPFILMLKDFAMDSIKPLTSPSDETEQTKPIEMEDAGVFLPPMSESPVSSKSPSPIASPVASTESGKETVDHGKMTIKAIVKKPLIVLVEDAEESDSRALVLSTNDVAFTMRSRSGNINMYSSISGLLISCSKVTNLRNTANQVLSPLSEPITATFDTFSSNTEVDVQVPALAFTLSPTTVRLILKVVKTLQPDSEQGDQEVGETSPSDLWTSRPLDLSRWYFQKEDKTKLFEGSSVDALIAPPDPSNMKTEFMKLFVNKVNVIIEQELPNGRTYAVVAMTMGKYNQQAVELNVYNWSGELKAKAAVTLEASYYNLSHDAWEPLLEPVIDTADESHYLPWTLEAEINKRPAIDIKKSRIASDGESKRSLKDDDLPAQMEVSVSSRSALQLTVTKSSLGVLKELMNTYQEDISLLTRSRIEIDAVDVHAAPETQEPAFFIRNGLGRNTMVTVKPKSTLKVHGAYTSKLEHNEEVPLHPIDKMPVVKPGELLPRSTHLKRAHVVTLEIGRFKPVDVILGTSDVVYYPIVPLEMSPKKKSPLKYGIVVEIIRKVGETVPRVNIRSPMQVKNHLNESITVLWSTDSVASTDLKEIDSIAKDSSLSVPLSCFDYPQGGLFFQPKLPNSGISNKAVKWNRNDEPQVLELECYIRGRGVEGQSRCKAFYIHADIKMKKYSKKPPVSLDERSHHVIHLHYPLVLQNVLPFPIEVVENSQSLESRTLQPGEMTHYSHVTILNDPRFLITLDYGGLKWEGEFHVNAKTSEKSHFEIQPATETRSMEKLSAKHQLLIGESHNLVVHKENKGTWHLSIQSPYWMINKTTLTLQYKKGSKTFITQTPDMTFALFTNETTCVRVVVDEKTQQTTDWSDSFSLDAIGSEGIFKCETSNESHVYQLGSAVHLSGGAHSNTVTISPLFMAFNKTKEEISFCLEVPTEEDSVDEVDFYVGAVITVPPNKLVPFWPKSGVRSMCLSVNDSMVSRVSRPFKFTETASILLRSNSDAKVPAIVVDIQVTGSANIVTFSPYFVGSVPFHLVNDTDLTLEFRQDSKEADSSYFLLPYRSLFYTWDEPSDNHALTWKVHMNKKAHSMQNIFPKDAHGEFPLPKRSVSGSISSNRSEPDSVFDEVNSVDISEMPDVDEEDEHRIIESGREESREAITETDSAISRTVRKTFGTVSRAIKTVNPLKRKKKGNTGYWVSFQDGLQRTVLFTTSKDVVDRVLMGNKTEQPSIDFTLSLIAVGLSLVNDVKGIEIAYIGIPQSDLHWEIEKRKNRFTGVSHELNIKLEQLYDEAKKESKVAVSDIPDSELKVDLRDLENMKLIDKGKRKKLRRLHMEGLRLEVSVCEHSLTIETKINEVQVDNMLLFSPNPTILYSYPPLPELASKFAPKPFIDSIIILRRSEHSTEIQLLQVLIQEMGVNIDLNFILAITGLLAGLPNMQTDTEVISEDKKHAEKPLEETKLAQVSAVSSRIYFKFLHLSPLDIHLSFSLDRDPVLDEESKAESEGNVIIRAILNLLNHFATIIGNAKNTELKLGYFEIENAALTQSALVDRITKHYVQQALLQVYKIIFGLELLGNPVGFVTGLKDGAIGLFYYPIQGAVLGPGEFFHGLALGGQQFFAGTVGGVSGALGKVVGVLAKTTTKLTMDDEFQAERKRVGAKGIGQGFEGAVKGVWGGVSGLVTQPIRGVRKHGFLGIFSGVTKGAVGLFLRPATGLLDLTSATLTVVQKKTQIGDYEVEQIRTARYIGPERIVYPFSPHMSTGYALFVSYDNGELVDTDTFFDYVEIVEEPLKALLITNMRFAVIKYSTLRGKWNDESSYRFENLEKPTTVKGKVIIIDYLEDRKEMFSSGFGLFGGKKKELPMETVDQAKTASRLINQAYEEYRMTMKIFGKQ